MRARWIRLYGTPKTPCQSHFLIGEICLANDAVQKTRFFKALRWYFCSISPFADAGFEGFTGLDKPHQRCQE